MRGLIRNNLYSMESNIILAFALHQTSFVFPFPVFLPILFGDFPQHPAGVAHGHHAVRDVPINYW